MQSRPDSNNTNLQVRDKNGDEADGLDETILPLDHEDAGQIIDDELLQRLVLPLPKGCKLTALMDCCHSGTALDLPYIFQATEAAMAPGANPFMVPNPEFNLEAVLQMVQQVSEAYQRGGLGAALVAGLSSEVGQRAVSSVLTSMLAGAGGKQGKAEQEEQE